jgi:hypothetical protein
MPSRPSGSAVELDLGTGVPNYKDTVIPVLPDSFPIGGFNFGINLYPTKSNPTLDERYKVNIIKEVGINVNYDGGFTSSYATTPNALNNQKFKVSGASVLAAPYMTGGLKNYAGLGVSYIGGEGSGNNCENRLFLSSNQSLLRDKASGQTTDIFGTNVTTFYDYETKQWDDNAHAYVSHNWGSKPSSNASITNGEYKIGLTASPATGYLLSNLANYDLSHFPSQSADDDKYAAEHWSLSKVLPGTISTAAIHCDFIYRIDANDIPLGSGGLFDIEYTLYKATYTYNSNTAQYDVTITTTQASDHITSTNYDQPTDPTESYNITWFPKNDPALKTAAHASAQKYSVIYRSFPVNGLSSKYWNPGAPIDGMWAYIRLECKLNRLTQMPIYVRGLRVRSSITDSVLRGMRKSELQGLFRRSKSVLQKITNSDNGKTAWDNIVAFCLGQELGVYQLRMLTYIDDLCYNTPGIGKHVLSYRAGGDPAYRAIYEDQNGVPSNSVSKSFNGAIAAPFQSEEAFWNTSSAAPWQDRRVHDPNLTNENRSAPLPKDAVAYSIRHISDNGGSLTHDAGNPIFTSFGIPITGGFNRIGPSSPGEIWTNSPGGQGYDGSGNAHTITKYEKPDGTWSTSLSANPSRPPTLDETNDGVSQGLTVVNYNDYTKRIQQKVGVMPGLSEALSAYPQYVAVEKWGKWFANGSVITDMPTMRLDGGPPVEPYRWATYHGRISSQVFEQRKASYLNLMQTDPANISNFPFRLNEITKSFDEQLLFNLEHVGDNPHHYDNGVVDYHDQFVSPQWFVRPELATEIRAGVWVQLCAGAKGVFYNSIGSDGNRDIGLLFSTSNKVVDYDPDGNIGMLANIPVCDCAHPLITPASPSDYSGTHLRDHVIVRFVQYPNSNPPLWFYAWELAPILDGSHNLMSDGQLATWIADQQQNHVPGRGQDFQLGGSNLPSDHWVSQVTSYCQSGTFQTAGTTGYISGDVGPPYTHFRCDDFDFSDYSDATKKIFITDPYQNGNEGATFQYTASSVDADHHGIILNGTIGFVGKNSSGVGIMKFYTSGNWVQIATDQTLTHTSSHTYAPWEVYRYPGDVWSQNTWCPTFYGFKEKWNGAYKVSHDLFPIASTLSHLNWEFTLNLANANSYGNSGLQSSLTDEEKKYEAINSKLLNGNPSRPLARRLPFDNIHSLYKLASDPTQYEDDPSANPEGGWFDPDVNSVQPEDAPERRLFQFGLFSDASEPLAQYITVCNRRTWPYYQNLEQGPQAIMIDPTAPSSASDNDKKWLGAIDARRLSMAPMRNLIDAGNLSNYYTIENLRSGEATTRAWNQVPFKGEDRYELDLDPGEGTLLRIAPTTSIDVGRTGYSGMAYNNGHRIADIRNVAPIGTCPAVPRRGICWEENGKIKFCIVDAQGPTALTTFQTQANQVRTVYDPQVEKSLAANNHTQDGHNPSIASKPDLSGGNLFIDTIAISYSIDDFTDDTHDASQRGARSVIFAVSTDLGVNWTKKTIENTTYTLDGVKDISGGRSDLHVPVITPAEDGFVGNYARYSNCATFWMHYTGGDWHKKGLNNMASNSNGQRRFPTISSVHEATSTNERFHIAWEEDYADSTSAIFYRWMDHHMPGGLPDYFTYGPVLEVTQDYGSCYHKHPMIATQKPPIVGGLTMPTITWEATDNDCHIERRQEIHGDQIVNVDVKVCSKGNTKAVMRELLGYTPTISWSSYGTAHSLKSNLPLPLLRVEDHLCAGVTVQSVREWVYQDTLSHQTFLHRATAVLPPNWASSRLQEYAQNPSVSMPYESEGAADLGTVTFRGIYSDNKGLYAARVIANPPVELSLGTTNPVQYFAAASKVHSCQPPLVSGGSDNTTIIIKQGDSSTELRIPWLYAPLGEFLQVETSDTTAILEQQQWPVTEDTLRTAYFDTQDSVQLDMLRVLRVDTSQLASLLPNSDHFVKYKLVLKDSATKAITQVLDSADLHGGSLLQGESYPGVDPSDTTITGVGYHIQTTIAPTASGKGYLTIIVTKDTASELEFVQYQEFDGHIELPSVPLDDSTSDSGAYKRSSPTPTSHQELLSRQALQIHVYPNPATSTLKVCVEEMQANLPSIIEIVNGEGERVALLYDEIPQGDLGFCIPFNVSQLPSGTYYVHVQNSVMGKAVKLQVIK